IEGDIHSIGKTIVGTMLKAYGFEVYDLGVDVRPEVIIQEAIKKDVDIIAVSALLTTTMVKQKRVVELLKDKKIRDKFKVILGGAPVTERWVEECGADGYAENAIIAVKVVKTLIKN
ncbi:MAG: B12-binding domain-containing protein, partial [Candidatus Heimdallarchaeota archaeon]